MASSKRFSPSLGAHLAQWMLSNDGVIIVGGGWWSCVKDSASLFAGIVGSRGGDSSIGKRVTISNSK